VTWHGQAYVPRTSSRPAGSGICLSGRRPPGGRRRHPQRANDLLRRVPARAWQWVSRQWMSPARVPKATACTTGRSSVWTQRLAPARPALAAGPAQPQEPRAGLYRCFMPRPVPLAMLVKSPGAARPSRNASRRQGPCGLDQHHVRHWRSWYHWTTLAMVAHAFLAVAALSNATAVPPVWPDRLDLQRGPTPVSNHTRSAGR
jgi:hypothetical protein